MSPAPELAPRRGRATRPFRLDLEYDGAGFQGWQRQPGERTVQQVVEEALARILSQEVGVVAAGRTDAGVHAEAMTTSFSARTALEERDLARALDAVLPEDVGVVALSQAAPGFHALRDARWKWYRYAILRSRFRRVALRRTTWRVGMRLDVDAMRDGAARLVGRRDFAAFQNAGSPRVSTTRCVAALAWSEDGPLLRLDAVADGFLYGMVRAIVGTLVEVGRGRRSAASLEDVVASRDRARAGPAAPAHGLALVRVGYAGDAPPAFVDRALAAGLESARTTKRPAREEPDGCGS
jgi:tRNA pseudouridine38-40 synthase